MSGIIWPLQYFNGILTKITFFIAMVIVSIMVLALSASALTRYISGHGFDWFIELPPALVSWLVFPLLVPLLKSGSHIEVDFLSHYLSEKSKNIIGTVVNLIALISACVFFKAGVDATTMYYNLGQMMELEINIPIWWMFLAFPVGFLILALSSLELIFENLLGLISK